MSAERVPHAQALVETVKDLLTRDEHVALAGQGVKRGTVSSVQDVDRRGRAGCCVRRLACCRTAPSSLPSAAQPDTANSQRGIGLKDATAVFDAITRALAADPELVLDIDWRLHPQDESAS